MGERPGDDMGVSGGRKIIQISNDSNSIYALCDDGTVWHWWYAAWQPLKDVPQSVPIVQPPTSLMTFRELLRDDKIHTI